MSLASATTPRRLDERRFAVEIPDGWQIGRGVFGGLVLANLVRAVDIIVAAHNKNERLRTLTAELCGPLQPGAAEILVEPLRLGSGTSTVAARMVQAGEVQAHAVVVLGRARGRDTDGDATPPAMIPWREAPETPGFVGFPVFAGNFEYRSTGAAPFSGAAEAHTSGWIRAREPGGPRDGGFVTAMADAWWPAIFSRLTAQRPMATVGFTLEWLGDLDGLDAAAPLYHDARTLASREGWSTEIRALWGEDGRLISLNHQTFVVIK